MVKFTSLLSRLTPHPASVPAVIDAAIASQEAELQESQTQVNVDLDPCLATVICPPNFDDTLTQILRNAISSSPQRGGELSISACRTNRGIEIEIADSNPLVDDLPRSAFSRCTTHASGSIQGQRLRATHQTGFDVYHTRCPQGGQAWTLVLTSRHALIRAA